MEDIIMIVLVSVRDKDLDITYNVGYVEDVEDFKVAKEAAENWLKHSQMSDEEFADIVVRKDRVSHAATTPASLYYLILSLLLPVLYF